jgi:hypothetical protein
MARRLEGLAEVSRGARVTKRSTRQAHLGGFVVAIGAPARYRTKLQRGARPNTPNPLMLANGKTSLPPLPRTTLGYVRR